MTDYDHGDMDYNMDYSDHHSSDILDGFDSYEPGLNLHYNMDFAQIGDKTLEEQQTYGEDPHDQSLKLSIDQNRNEFNSMIEEILNEYENNLFEDVDEAEQNLEELKQAVAMEGDEAFDELSEYINSLIEIMTADNQSRYDRFVEWSGEELGNVASKINENIGKVNTWFGDRLEWIEGLYDDHYKQELKTQLIEKRDAALADL